MKIETITVMERLNKGNYEYLEISASAKIEEGEDAMSALLALRTYVLTGLTTSVEKQATETQTPVVVDTPKTIVDGVSSDLEVKADETQEVEEKKTKAKRTKKAKETQAESENVVNKPHHYIVYDRSIDNHKNLLSSHLNSNIPTWKTSKPKEEIVAFTASLEGKEFLDENGVIVESFKKLLNDFFA